MTDEAETSAASGPVHRVYREILSALEQGAIVPGQRLIETDLAQQFGAGRNAVREAMHLLSGRGVVDLSRNKSPAIRRLDSEETMEVLAVARAMTGLVMQIAATNFSEKAYGTTLAQAQAAITNAAREDETPVFSRARRELYRTLLQIGRNRELQRLFPAIGMYIIHAQYPTRKLRGIRLADYEAMIAAVRANNPAAAEKAAHRHVDTVKKIIAEQISTRQES